MRDEDLKNLPQSIERWRFLEMLEKLGFGDSAQNNLRGFVVSTDAIRAVVYATDDQGRRIASRQMDQIPVTELGEKEPSFVGGNWRSEPVTHQISIPFVGSWEKPAAKAEVFPCPDRCQATSRHHHFRDESGIAWAHLSVPKEQEHTECLLPECPGPVALRRIAPQASESVCGVEHEVDFVSCQKPQGHAGHHGGIGEDGGAYAW